MDVLASPNQNPLGIQYLSRTDNRLDSLSMHTDFWAHDFTSTLLSHEEYLYVFPPPRMTAAAAKHLALTTDCTTVWLIEDQYTDILMQALAIS